MRFQRSCAPSACTWLVTSLSISLASSVLSRKSLRALPASPIISDYSSKKYKHLSLVLTQIHWLPDAELSLAVAPTKRQCLYLIISVVGVAYNSFEYIILLINHTINCEQRWLEMGLPVTVVLRPESQYVSSYTFSPEQNLAQVKTKHYCREQIATHVFAWILPPTPLTPHLIYFRHI